MADSHYTFSASPNSYYMGRDLIVTNIVSGEIIRVNEKDGMLAVDVKDRIIRREWPGDVQVAADEIGDGKVQTAYEAAQRDFWTCAENDSAEYGFHAYSAGRSAGWLAVDGTQRLDVRGLIEPDEEDAELRDKFLRFAFEQRAAVEHFRAQFYDKVKEIAAAPVCKCPNCGKELDAQKPGHTTGCVFKEIDDQMRSRLDDLALLVGTAEGKGEGWADPDKLEALGIEDKHADPEIGTAEEEAQERLDEYPLAVERTMVFEVVIGTGGPDDRLIFECSENSGHPINGNYEIDRVLYRYSWTGSAERELTGEDRETAEELARRVVPELVE